MTSRATLTLIDGRAARVEEIWRTLEAAARPGYFLSWAWVGTWLAALPVDRVPALAVLEADGASLAACFLGRTRVRRHLVVASDVLYFNAVAAAPGAGPASHANALLARPGAPRSLAELLELLPGPWDELVLPGLARYAFDDLGARPAGTRRSPYRIAVEREAVAPFVDLSAVRGVRGGYPALLPASTRNQLVRARRLLGDVVLEVARDEPQALAIYGELQRLRARHGGGVPRSPPWVERFHQQLIRTRLPHGEIELVRIHAGRMPVGCLFNLVAGTHVTSYLRGFAPLPDPGLRGSYLALAATIETHARAGAARFELAGAAPEDQALATGVNRLIWVRVQRPRARFAFEREVGRVAQWLERVPPRLALRPG